jgi:hypothetical protein
MYEGTKHSSATAWLAQGSSLQMIQRMLRHADSRSTERYAKLGDLALVDLIRPRARRIVDPMWDPAEFRPRKPFVRKRKVAGRTGLEPGGRGRKLAGSFGFSARRWWILCGSSGRNTVVAVRHG